MKKEKNFMICFDTQNPDNDNTKEYDYVPVTAETMKEALEKSADEIQRHTGKNYPIDFIDTMKFNAGATYDTQNWKDIVEYINENSVDIDLSAILETLAGDQDLDISMAANEFIEKKSKGHVISASDLKAAKVEKDVRDAVVLKHEQQKQRNKEQDLE